jgi:hypothetical protein
MADVLKDFEANQLGSGNRATNGGKQDPKPIPYSPPTGRGGSTSGPGLGGTNHGCCGTQGKH